VELIVVRPEEFAQAAVDAFGHALVRAERPCLALPTGSTPVPFYRRLAETRFAFPPGTRAFALDEFVAPDAEAPGSNAAFFRRHWPPDFPPVAMPRADAADPEAEIAAYCAAVAACGPLDIAVLGIGVNGHIAFNEPGSGLADGCRVVRLAERTREAAAREWPEGVPEYGLTMGIAEIMAARRVMLLATGPAKRHVVHAALTGPVMGEIPASFLQRHPALTVVCDTAAGALLTQES